MRKTMFLTSLMMLLSLLVLGGFAPSAEAHATPYVMPQSSRIVVFNYSRFRTYTILTRPMTVTDIQLAPGEKLETLAIGDSVQWITALAPGNIMIKPTRSGLFTSATIITNKRVYELTLRSGPLTGRWYQQVSWQYPQILLYNEQVAAQAQSARRKARAKRHAQVAGVVNNPAKLNFDYAIRGHASFKPHLVFDNGVWTWIHLPTHAQVVPALFVRRSNGKYALTRYVVHGHYIIVQRTFRRALLRQGRRTITLINRHAHSYHHRHYHFMSKNMSAGG
jgi:type IV secretion system protein VirB9